jgi:LysM repeat protein
MSSDIVPLDTYQVVEGDTLVGISLKVGVSVVQLKRYNHLFGKNDIFVGQVRIIDYL